jgi:hypothetical protein
MKCEYNIHCNISCKNWRSCCPLYYIHDEYDICAKNVPPIMTIHGTADTVVPIQDACLFHSRLQQYRSLHGINESISDIFLQLSGVYHSFNASPTIRSYVVLQAIDAFLERITKK